MTTLTVYAETDASRALNHLQDFGAIRELLAGLGVEFERWEASRPLSATAAPEEVFAAYADAIETLKKKYGFVTVDVVSMHPEHPNAAEARGKFLAEHTHDDFETRFFVDGAGAFYIRAGGKVYQLICTQGDLINLPANTTHWFDMGPKPNFKAIRFFRIPEGWVGRFTGDAIAERFPKYEAAA
ncbi:1,2-dihydroxy-3-keto-5-methylthiopentene dioxygenase [Solimonas aquatica]|uniref:Acireductone dioxygenase n=1 Tax=Solimonas aquatica TaxID=489703 RepID=A0A1H9GP43_9GAMM|nr:cupin [Solimonas aquatica]SEQ51708.1 1,2-dihydroxy-3-keto-5-methylthiopentene dioxygenase [Solimonas aquatica]